MNKSIACVFPETLPNRRLLAPLVQVFGQLVHMQAIENQPPARGVEDPFIERCLQQGRLQQFTPVPLGEDRDRFLALVQDMSRQGAAYINQLSMLTLAGLNQRTVPDSHRSIVSKLLQGGTIAAQEETQSILWQSRLIVMLGELFDIEQAELNSALQDITCQQDDLLSKLCEEEENPFVLPASTRNVGQDTEGILRHRLKAWTRLCFHNATSAPGLLVTRHQSALDLLVEVYEKMHRQSARQLISLEIPVLASASGEEASLENAFAEPFIQRCPSLDKAMERLANTDYTLTPDQEMEELFRAGQSEWVQAISPLAPEQTEGPILDLIVFPAISVQRLLQEGFVGCDVQAEEGKGAGCVIGLLRMG